MAQAEIIIADDALWPEAVEVYNAAIRPKVDISYFKRNLLGHHNALTLLAHLPEPGGRDRPIGLWIGFEERPQLYRHWLGVVHPEFRRMGIARQLLEAGCAWAAEHEYDAIRCEAMNRQKEYVALAIDSGFDIIGLRYEDSRADNMVVFEKSLIDHGEPSEDFDL